MSSTPIADHALLSDRHSSALVDRGRLGRVAVLPALRRAVGVRPAARRRRRALAGPAGRRVAVAPAATSAGRWCWRPPSPPTTARSCSPTRWRWARQRRAPTRPRRPARAGAPAWPAPPVRWRSTSTTARGRSTAWSCPLLSASTAGSRRAAAPMAGADPARSGWTWPARPAHGATAPARPATSSTSRCTVAPSSDAARARLDPAGPRRAAGRHADRVASRGRDLHQTLPGPLAGPGAPQRPGAARRCPTSPAARSSPPAPPRCPRAWAASATGTTATPGSATRASRWRPCGSPPAPTRPMTSSPS